MQMPSTSARLLHRLPEMYDDGVAGTEQRMLSGCPLLGIINFLTLQ